MFSVPGKGSRAFNPFNLPEEEGDTGKKIKFERLPRSVRTKPMWWLITVFVLAFLVYYYLTTAVSN